MVMPADKQRTMPECAVGTLVSWQVARGYGYARCDHGGADILVASKEVLRSGIAKDDLHVGMRLAFVLATDDPHGPRALHIRVLSGGTA